MDLWPPLVQVLDVTVWQNVDNEVMAQYMTSYVAEVILSIPTIIKPSFEVHRGVLAATRASKSPRRLLFFLPFLVLVMAGVQITVEQIADFPVPGSGTRELHGSVCQWSERSRYFFWLAAHDDARLGKVIWRPLRHHACYFRIGETTKTTRSSTCSASFLQACRVERRLRKFYDQFDIFLRAPRSGSCMFGVCVA